MNQSKRKRRTSRKFCGNVNSASTWKRLQDEAKKRIENADVAKPGPSPDVLNHWKDIANGIVPFGFTVSD